MTDLSVVIPIYNEGANIIPLVKSISSHLHSIKHEIIFVDDGSNDGTDVIMNKLQKNKKNIKFINRGAKLGLSSAVLAGLAHAQGRYVCVMDGDLQHDPKYIPRMYSEVRKGTGCIVIGSRFIKDMHNQQRIDSRLGTFICRHVIGINAKDPLSGFFMLERRMFIELAPRINAVGYKILLELLARGKFSRIVEVPIVFRMRKRGSSKLDIRTRLEFVKQAGGLIL